MKNIIEMLEKRKKDIEDGIKYNQDSLLLAEHDRNLALEAIKVSQENLDELHTAIEILKDHFEDDI